MKDVLNVCSEGMNLILKNPIEDMDNDKALNFFGIKFIHFGLNIRECVKRRRKN